MNWAKLQDKTSSKLLIFAFHLAWGCILWWSVATNGLGTSRDSVEYLFTSLNLSNGAGFFSFQGQPYILWPPLYPILLSFLQITGTSDPMKAAFVLQWVTFGWFVVLFFELFSRMFPRNFALAFLGNALAGTGAALTILFQSVGSDYLFIALTLSMIYLCCSYIADNRIQTLWWMVVVSALAMLQRYIGITVLFTGLWIVYYYTRAAIGEKLKRSILLGLSAIPLAIWAFSLPVEAVVRRQWSGLLEKMYQLTLSLLTWFFPSSQLDGHPVRLQFGMWGIWLGIVMISLFFWNFRGRSPGAAAIGIPAFLFGAIYTIVLLALASLTSFNYLESRFVAPLWIPFVILVLATMEIILSFVSVKGYMQKAIQTVVYVPLLVLLALSGYQSMTAIRLHREVGWGYTSKDWNNNTVIDYWLTHRPDEESLVLSNYPAGVAVHAWQVTLSSPRRTSHPNVGEDLIPLDTQLSALFVSEKDSYLIWIEPNEYTHVYTVEDLEAIMNVETVYESEDGGIYKLLSLK